MTNREIDLLELLMKMMKDKTREEILALLKKPGKPSNSPHAENE